MNFQTDNVDWTTNLEEFLKMLGEHSLCLSILHKDSERHFSSKAMFIDLPVIVFSTICGSLTLSANNIFGEENENNALKGVGALSLITGVLGTIQSYFGYNRSAENHRISYLQYSKLYRFIKVQLGLPREQRILPKDLLKMVIENFERLNEISNLIPDKISSKFKSKYKKEKIKRPEIVNGLEEIEIYSVLNKSKLDKEQDCSFCGGDEMTNTDIELGLTKLVNDGNKKNSKLSTINEKLEKSEEKSEEKGENKTVNDSNNI